MKVYKKLSILLLIIFLLTMLSGISGITASFAVNLDPPAGFTAEIHGDDYIQLDWADNNQYSSYTIIEKSIDQGPFSSIATLSKNTSTYKDYSISNGHIYTYRARTRYSSSYSQYTEEHEVIVLYPDSFNITRALSDQVDLEWTYPTLPILRYPEFETLIERRTSGKSTWTLIATVPSPENTYRDTTVSSDTTYYYRIRTRYPNGSYSEYEPSSSGRSTKTAYPLTTPLWGYAVSDTKIRLEWDISLVEGDGAVILQRQDSMGDFEQIYRTETASFYTDSGLDEGKAYSYRLVLRSEDGSYSEYTDVIEVMTETVPFPTDFSAWAVSADSAALSWSYPFETETGFEIWRKSEDTWELAAVLPKNSEAFTDPSIKAGKSYTYKVRAIRGSNVFSAFSQEKTFTNAYPKKPGPLVYYAINGFMLISSSEPVPPNTTHTLEFRTGLNDPWKEYASAKIDTLIAYIGYSGSSEYYFRLRSSSGGLSSYSPEFHFYGSAPDAIQNLHAPLTGYDRVVLAWEDVSPKEDGYTIYRTSNGVRSVVGYADKDAESFTDENPVPGSVSVYEVVGYNAIGESAKKTVSVSVPNAVLYGDIASYGWAHTAIYALQGLGALDSTTGGYFYPQNTISRGQVTRMILKSFDIPYSNRGVFTLTDVTPVHPYYKDLMTAASLGIIHPDPMGRVYPDQAVTRKELMILLNNTLGYLNIPLNTYPVESLERFNDYPQISENDAPITASFTGDGIITGKNGALYLSDKSTKVEAVVMIYRTLQKYVRSR